MTPFVQYIKSTMEKLGIKNYTQFGLKIGQSQSAMSQIMHGQYIPKDDIILKIADLSGDDPEQVLMIAHASKATEKSKPYWDTLLKKVVNISLCFSILFNAFPSLYIMLNYFSPRKTATA